MVSLLERFEAKFTPEPSCGCWLWLGGTNEHGYGIIGLGAREKGVDKAHRVSWRLYRGEIPEGGIICHRCDNPACVNPDHLYCGTMKSNSRDMVRRGRNYVHDNSGMKARWAKLTDKMVLDIRTKRMKPAAFAKLYNVSRGAIYNIWNGLSWGSVR